MPGLWSRAAPAQSTCRHVSCLSTASNGVASRAGSAASKRRLRIGNSVTALYTSIFAAATLADAQAKGQRRLEWEEKIAAVKQEVNELVDEEQRLLESLSRRRKPKAFLNGALQSRQFGTAARPTYMRHQWPMRGAPFASFHSMTTFDQIEDTQLRMAEHGNGNEEMGWDELRGEEDGENAKQDDYGLALNDNQDVPEWASGDIIRQKVIRKLALKQLAIRLLLRPAIAHSYLGVERDYDPDGEAPQLSVPELLQELHYTRSRQTRIKNSPGSNIDDLAVELRTQSVRQLEEERDRLSDEVRQDTQLFLNNQMTLQELLLRLSSALMHCTDPDRPEILKMMINAFTKSQQNDLNDLVLRTVLPHKFPMSPSLIFSIITFFRKSGNLRGFNHFLGTLCGDGYPVDMGRLALYLRRTVNGVEIIIPPVHSANPVIYAALIMTCLRFGQPDRADAYLVYARSTGFMDDYATLGAYLKFYTIRKDWEKGVQTMRRTMAFMASSTELATFRIERLIVFMVNLCDACKQYDMSQAIITSAVNSGFDPRMADDQADIVFDYDPDCARWSLAVTPDSRLLENNRPCEKSYAFVDAMSERIAEHEGKPTTKTWQDLMGKYSQEVLSSILASPVADRKTSSSPSSSPSSSSNLSPANVPQDLFDQIRTQAEATKAQSGSTSSAHAEKLKALELDITKLKKGSSAQRLTSLQQEISKLNKDISQFTSHTENHTSLRKEISKLKKDFSNESSVHAQQATSLQQEVSKLKRELYESSEHSHTQELKMLGAEISELKQQVAAEADKVQEITSLRAEIFELKKMVFNFHQPTTKKPTTKKPTTKKPTTTSSRQPTTKNPKTTSSRQTMMKNPTNSSSRQTTTKNPKTTSSRQTTTKNPTTTSSHQTTTKNPTTPSSQTTMEDPTTPSSQTATDDPTTTSSEPSPSQKEGRLADFRRRYPNFLETMIANNSAMTSSQYPDDLSNSQYHAADLEKIGADFTLHDPTTDDSTTTSPQPPRRLSRADRRIANYMIINFNNRKKNRQAALDRASAKE